MQIAAVLITMTLFGLFWSSRSQVGTKYPPCFSHDECPDTKHFCSWSQCEDVTGWRYRCGSCMPCTSCTCHATAIDDLCPADRCPDAPTQGVRRLAGDFWSVDRIRPPLAELGYACVRSISFSGSSFSEMQAPVSLADPATPPPPNDAVSRAATAASCSSYERSGIFDLDVGTSPPTINLDILAARSGPPLHSLSRAPLPCPDTSISSLRPAIAPPSNTPRRPYSN